LRKSPPGHGRLQLAKAQDRAADCVVGSRDAHDLLRFAIANRRRAGGQLEGGTDQRTAMAAMLDDARQDVATFAALVELAERVAAT
jgi:hypothetical protein